VVERGRLLRRAARAGFEVFRLFQEEKTARAAGAVCSKPEGGGSWGSEEDKQMLDKLLRAHEEVVAGQRARLDALELMRTFSPLGMGDVGVTEFPEDLRRIAADVEVLRVESAPLRKLPSWLGSWRT
jgi:hypothetical protein